MVTVQWSTQVVGSTACAKGQGGRHSERCAQKRTGEGTGFRGSGDRLHMTELPTVGNDDNGLVDVSQHPVVVKRYLILRCKQVCGIQLSLSRARPLQRAQLRESTAQSCDSEKIAKCAARSTGPGARPEGLGQWCRDPPVERKQGRPFEYGGGKDGKPGRFVA